MPVATKKPDVVEERQELPVGQILKEKEIYKTATVDNAINPPESLVLYMEGMPWTVDYYSQLIDRHEEIKEVDTSQNAAMQQYRKLNRIELRVQGDLSTNYDESTGRNDVTGSAIAYGIIPNTFDYFVTDVGTKGLGLFMVTNSTRKTYNNDSVYEITYIMVGYVDSGTAQERYEALEARVVKEFHFHKERLQAGQVALLTTEEHGDVKRLMREYGTMTTSYISFYVDQRDRLFIVPHSEYTYDPRVAEFTLDIIDHDIAPGAAHVNRPSYDRNPYLKLESIWSILKARNAGLLKAAAQKVSIVSRSFFVQNSFMVALNCWDIDWYVFPNLDECAEKFHRLPRHDNAPAVINDFNVVSFSDEMLVEYAGRQIPMIYPVHKDGYYVLSKAFYEQDKTQMSLLEILVSDFLSGATINLKHLDLMVSKAYNWTDIEKFYYHPLLLVLMKEAVAGYY